MLFLLRNQNKHKYKIFLWKFVENTNRVEIRDTFSFPAFQLYVQSYMNNILIIAIA